MLIKFHTIGQIEKGVYPFEKAVASADTVNGAFGSVASGVFSVGADAKKAIMNAEVGDDEGINEYKIYKGQELRVVDFEKLDGQTMEIYGEMPSEVTVGTKLKSDASGKLITGATAAPCFEVIDTIETSAGIDGVVVTVTMTDSE